MDMQNNLPLEAQALAAHLDAQPRSIQVIVQYCVGMAMVESGKAELINTKPSEDGTLCTFETVAGDVFTLPKPPMDTDTETLVMEMLRNILEEEGWL
ncbi:MAG: hypothetical protein JW953_17600 [Anaerolineae bacterium]|nr:hypothetical protein [Anaerolineae bacterium]